MSVKKSKFDPKSTKCLIIGYSDNTIAYLLQNIKTRQILTSGNVRFNKNNQPGFYKETEDNSFLYLYLDEVKEELQYTSNSSELSSEVETTETESDQDSENKTETEVDQEIKKANSKRQTKVKIYSSI